MHVFLNFINYFHIINPKTAAMSQKQLRSGHISDKSVGKISNPRFYNNEVVRRLSFSCLLSSWICFNNRHCLHRNGQNVKNGHFHARPQVGGVFPAKPRNLYNAMQNEPFRESMPFPHKQLKCDRQSPFLAWNVFIALAYEHVASKLK